MERYLRTYVQLVRTAQTRFCAGEEQPQKNDEKSGRKTIILLFDNRHAERFSCFPLVSTGNTLTYLLLL
jgi:hypothetical protein